MALIGRTLYSLMESGAVDVNRAQLNQTWGPDVPPGQIQEEGGARRRKRTLRDIPTYLCHGGDKQRAGWNGSYASMGPTLSSSWPSA